MELKLTTPKLPAGILFHGDAPNNLHAPRTVDFFALCHNKARPAAVPTPLRVPRIVHPCYVVSWAPQESSPFQDSDPAAVIATALKRTPGAGRERVIDPDNLTSPACAPETYGGPAGAGGGGANSNPITGDLLLVLAGF